MTSARASNADCPLLFLPLFLFPPAGRHSTQASNSTLCRAWAAAAAAAAAAKEAGAEAKAAEKREKEKARSALKKARKELKALGESERWARRAADLEVVAAALPLEQMQALQLALGGDDEDAAAAALDAALKTSMAQ